MASQQVKVSGRGAKNVKVSQSNKDGKISQHVSMTVNTVSGGRGGIRSHRTPSAPKYAGTRRPSAPSVARVRKPNGPRKA